MKPKKSLQKFTELISIDELKKQISRSDKSTLIEYQEEITKRININMQMIGSINLSKDERKKNSQQLEENEEMLLLIYESLYTSDFSEKKEKLRRTTFDLNRRAILFEIDKCVKEHNRFPNQTEISIQTGLSRTTIIKHLNELATDHEYNEIKQSTAIMLPVVMAKLYQLCIKGDVRALKTYLDFHKHSEATLYIKNQQNNLQINKFGKDLADESCL